MSEQISKTLYVKQEQTSSFQIKTISHRRKAFKKYLMSIGYQRNDAEAFCNNIKIHKGLISYTNFNSNIFLYFLRGDLNASSF